jgi:hypothetical protein
MTAQAVMPMIIENRIIAANSSTKVKPRLNFPGVVSA